MALPTYDKSKRRKAFKQLPKGAYVIEFKGCRQEKNKNGNGEHLTLPFDIAEGEYKGFYQNQYNNNSNEDKKWPFDAIHYLTIPQDDSPAYAWDNWNTFFADLEDSNGGFVFSGDIKTLKGKQIGGKFALEQTESNGNIYDHTRLRWTCVADDVRSGDFGSMPKDKLISNNSTTMDTAGFMSIPEGTDEEVPF